MKIDLHCHSYYSKDGISSPERLIKSAVEKGLDGIALTDHDTAAGWKEAIEAAEKSNITLILGEEIKTKRNGKTVGDILGLFLEEEIKSREPFEVIKEIKNQGGIVIIPHPFHFPENFKDNLEKYKDLIDGVEVFSGRLPFSLFDKKASQFAKNHNLAMVGGSDAHWHKNVGNGFTLAEKAENLEDFKKTILERKTKGEGKKSSFVFLLLPALARLGFKEKKRTKDLF